MTPTPQSVVVPVERVNRYLDRLAKSRQHDQERIHAFDLGEPSEAELFVSDLHALVKAAAPAQSSLAGGWLIREADGGWMWTGARIAATAALTEGLEVVSLAALSPEAPAREGVVFDPDAPELAQMATCCVMAIERIKKWSDDKDLLTAHCHASVLAQDLPAALTPRHEAPFFIKDGEDPAEFRALGKRLADTDHEASAEGAGEIASAARALLDACYKADENSDLSDFVDGMLLTRLDKALSARSSAPEAREGEAVRWTEDMERERREADYERGFRHGKKSAFDDAGSEPVAWRGRDPDAFGDGAWAVCSFKPSCDVVEPLYTHPAAPSADKLRIAVEILINTKRMLADKAIMPVQRVSWASKDVEKALAALEAEGAK